MRIVLVVPTYNEAENIGRLIDVLQEVFAKDPANDYRLLVVEGNSPDGTANIVKEKMEHFTNVHLLMEQKKSGLGAAYIYGFKYAMENMAPDVLIEMDADFQHDPHDVVKMVAKISEGYDYVIGSRFTSGGSIPKEWAFYRKLISIGGNIFSKLVLNIWSVNDFTSGFKASRVKNFAEKLDFDSVLSGGFAYKIDLLYKMHRLGAKIAEIPIAFGLRDRGISKMERNNFIDSLKVVLMLRMYENKAFYKFVMVGFAGLFVDTTLFNILRLILPASHTAALVSGFIAMMTTFTLNNFWSFNERKIESTSHKVLGFIIYVASSYVPIQIRSMLVDYATEHFGDTFVVSNIAFFIGIVFGLVWNFTVYSRIIWRKKGGN
ncbi:glycosyltransferase family 2 protein [candidate division WWE3 bacterium]|uniref:Glycosyltransferase family 2 protein n=1 Tax=candidate division WWE3 bacterium TaxID=2053526 RepID=A0A7X9HGW2_UNCKA|nr:glycosyltransferase family 2 protein [candidate division WWE3 bacterium]